MNKKKSLVQNIIVLTFLSFALLLTTFNSGFAQDQQVIDSLTKVISDVEKQCLVPCPNDTDRINAYLLWGEQIYLHQPDSAVSLWNAAVQIAENLLAINSITEVKHAPVVNYTNKCLAMLLNNIGYIYSTRGEIPRALEYYNKSLTIRKELGDKLGIAESLNNMGVIYDDQGYVIKALEYYNKSVSLYLEIGNKDGLAYSYNNLGATYYIQGDIPKALEYYHKSLNMQEELGNKQGMGLAINNIGIIYKNQGDIPKALEFFDKSLILKEEVGDKIGMAQTINNMAVIYRGQGDNIKALEYYQKSTNICEEIGNKTGMALSINNIGFIYKNQASEAKYKHDYAKSDSLIKIALEFFQKSLNIREGTGDKHGMAESLNAIGFLYKDEDNFYKALEYFQKSLNICEEIGDKKGISYTLFGLGVTSQKQNNIFKLNEYATRCLIISKDLGFQDRIESAVNLMKDLRIKQNNFESADSFAIEMIDINNKAILSNFATLSETGQEKYFKTVAINYMDFNSYALIRKLENPKIVDFVFNNTLKNKGLLLKSSTAMRNAVLNSEDTLLIDNYYKWVHIKKQIAKLCSKGKDTKELDEQANEYEKQLVKGSQLFSDFKKLQNITWQDVQKGLNQDEAAVEFVHFKYKNYESEDFNKFTDTTLYCVLIIKPESQHPEMLVLFNEKELGNILGKFEENNFSYISGIYGKNSEAKKELYNLIWKPMEEYLKDVKTVYLSPTGLLHKISFAALCKKQNVYLCDNIDIKVQSSTGKLASDSYRDLENSAFTNNMTTSLFGGINYNSDSTDTYPDNYRDMGWKYLEGTKTETEKIEKILKKGNIEVTYFANNTATEEEFKLIASNSNLLHIATHGFFYSDPEQISTEGENVIGDEDGEIIFRGENRGFGVQSFVKNNNPLMRSGLVFAGANDVWNREEQSEGEDGVLTAQEVAHIDMRKTNLVVMSACETGLGDIKGSEGVYGLQRAFKMAGVKYIIMSLWQVPDKETVEFMEMFYKKLLKTKDVRMSFNETQKEMRKKYDPYYWGAFVLVE
ncbi:MAG: tetratricopeptide repeat protein [Bacteroidota bacterium]